MFYSEVNVYDGSIGRDGQYVWKKLPRQMTRQEADKYARMMNWCPPEQYR